MLQKTLNDGVILINNATKPVKSSNKPEPIEFKPTARQGVVYIAPGGQIFDEPKLTLEYISELSQSNIYARSVLNKLLWLVFTGEPDIKVYDPSGNPVPAGTPGKPTLYNDIKTMLEVPEVDLWGNMQWALIDSYWWGNCILNPVWQYVGNVYTLTELTRLAPESFCYEPPEGEVYNPLLKGITLKNGTPVYYYQDNEGNVKELKNYHSIQPPHSMKLGGSPMIQPLILPLAYLNQAWTAVSQTTNRAGAPSLFLRVTDGDEDTIAYCREVLRNWGKNTSFPLPENVEIVDPHIKEPANTAEAIRMLQNLLIDYFSPVSLLQSGERGGIFDNSTEKVALIMAFIEGMHSWLEDAFEKLLQVYLIANRYDGYSVRIKLPLPDIDRTEANQRWVEVLANAKVPIVNTNELRRFVPNVEELDDAGLAALKEEMAVAPAVSPMMQQEEPLVTNMATLQTPTEQEGYDEIHRALNNARKDIMAQLQEAGYINA